MVDHPREVRVYDGTLFENKTQLKLTCRDEDLGKIIGINGRNVRSIRQILVAISRSSNHTFILDVCKDTGVSTAKAAAARN